MNILPFLKPDPLEKPPAKIKMLAYGSPAMKSVISADGKGGELYRLQRGFPRQRLGHTVQAVPQFKALRIYSIAVTRTTLIPGTNEQAGSIIYPTLGNL